MTRAAVLQEYGGDFEIWDLEVPAPRSHDVVVRLAASGICHSDFSIRSGALPFVPGFPLVLGHEGSGVVEEVGDAVSRVKPGDHVVMSFKPFCGRCWYCKRGEGYLCVNDGGGLPATYGSGSREVLSLGTATFSERAVVLEESLVKVRDSASLQAAALLGCGVMTGFGAAVNTATVRPGDSVVVVGCGGVGLSAIQGARFREAGEIIAVDLLDPKLALAKSFGATLTINASEGDPVTQVKDLTGGRGADHVLEVIGLKKTIDQALAMIRPGGEAVLVGLPALDVAVEASAVGLVMGNQRIVGSMYGSANFPTEVGTLLDLYDDGRLQLDELITRRLALDEIQQGFDAMAAGEDARSVIVYGGGSPS